MKLWLNGKPSTPSDIMHQCMIREEEEYMRDFVSDDDDHIIGIGFDYIKERGLMTNPHSTEDNHTRSKDYKNVDLSHLSFINL